MLTLRLFVQRQQFQSMRINVLKTQDSRTPMRPSRSVANPSPDSDDDEVPVPSASVPARPRTCCGEVLCCS